ncbi:ITGB1, partial [Cordylochernes scorpioides]
MFQLGGIVQPNDELCHLDDRGYYTESIYQDYPSLSQISRQLAAHKVNVVFAIPQARVPVYEQLSAHIEGSHIGILSDDSSNIVHIIRDQYNATCSHTTMVCVENPVGGGDEAPCPQPGYQGFILLQMSGVNFTVQVELQSCPQNPRLWHQTIELSPLGLRDSVSLEVDLFCQCQCEHSQISQQFGRGKNIEGLLILTVSSTLTEPGAGGPESEMFRQWHVQLWSVHLQCQPPRPSLRVSGRGLYQEGTTGSLQELFINSIVVDVKCDSVCVSAEIQIQMLSALAEETVSVASVNVASCERDHEGQVCGGPSRGSCCDGRCHCKPGYTGPACECALDTSLCKAPGDDRLCSGNGNCICGKCRCHRDGVHGSFGGQFCEDCRTCEGRCEDLRPCVQHHAFKTGPYSVEEFSANCSHLAIQAHPIIGECCVALRCRETRLSCVVESEESPYEKLCIFKDDDDCSYVFTYSYNNKYQLEVKLAFNGQLFRRPYVLMVVVWFPECPEPANVILIVVLVASGVVLLGLLLLLLWRLLVWFQDRRDYQRFLHDLSNTQWGE